MSVIYALVGYDKQTERMTSREYLRVSDTAAAKKIAGIILDDDTQSGDLELDTPQTKDIARLMKIDIDPSLCDYFLEPYTQADE